MKTKKTTKTAGAKTAAESRNGDLAMLNKLYGKFRRASDCLQAEYRKAWAEIDDSFCGKKKAARLAEAQFNLWKKRMPPVKFNMATGEYFYANDERGKEVFAIKVSKTESCVYVVAAKDLEEAKEKAMRLFEKSDEGRCRTTTAEDYSR